MISIWWVLYAVVTIVMTLVYVKQNSSRIVDIGPSSISVLNLSPTNVTYLTNPALDHYLGDYGFYPNAASATTVYGVIQRCTDAAIRLVQYDMVMYSFDNTNSPIMTDNNQVLVNTRIEVRDLNNVKIPGTASVANLNTTDRGASLTYTFDRPLPQNTPFVVQFDMDASPTIDITHQANVYGRLYGRT